MTRAATTFGVRVAGLPATVLDELCSWRLRQRLVTLSGQAADLTAVAAGLSDRCHHVIGSLADPSAKPKLVALRRAVHQLRGTSRLLAEPAVAAALGPGLTAEIAVFDRLVRRHRADRAELPAVVAQADKAIGARLLAISADERFDQGLAYASPTLHGQLRRRPRRQELVRLAVYAARAAAKTSPFSTFAASGLGRFIADGPTLHWTATAPQESVVELDLSVIAALAGVGADDLPLRVNPSAHIVGESIRFLGGGGPTEALLQLPLTAALRHCLRAAGDEPTLAELAAALPVPSEKAAEYLRSLVSVGLLLTRTPWDEHCVDPLRTLVDRLPELHPLREGLRSYGSASGPDRIRLGSALRAHLSRHGIGGDLRDAVTEQSVIPGVVVEAGLPAWRETLDDLAAAGRLLAVFDSTLPYKLAVAEFLRDRHGSDARVPILQFYEELTTDGREAMRLHPAAVAFDTKGLTAALAATAVTQVRELGELVIRVRQALPDRDEVDKVLAEAPAWLRPPGSLAVYAQHDGTDLFVNAVNSGFGRGRSWVRRLLGAVEDEPVPVDTVHSGRGGYAEFAQTLATSLNLREMTLPDRIDYPPSTGLHVGLDADGLPVLLDHDAVVRPVHGGLSYERQLPPAMALMIEAFGENPTLLRLEQPLRHDVGAASHGARVPHTPRLRIGRVVLRRATWLAQPGTLPRRAAGESDADFLLRLAQWLQENHIPPQFFVSVFPPRALSVDTLVRNRARKPMYVDIGSPPLVAAFERLARDAGSTAVLSEVAPGPEAALRDHQGVPRVTEYLIEIDCRKGESWSNSSGAA